MIRMVGVFFMMVAAIGAVAQDSISQLLESDYIDEAHRIREVSEVNRLSSQLYRQKFGEEPAALNMVTDIPPNGAYYRIVFEKTPYLADTGLLDIWHRRLADDTASIEQLTERYYGVLKGDNPDHGYVIDYVKSMSMQAGYFFGEDGHAVYVVMRSPGGEFVMATIEMDLTAREKLVLARDFIRKTRFVGG